MKAENPDLWTLIKRLDQSEIRYAKLFLKAFTLKKDRYLKLFVTLLKQENYDERTLLKKLKSEFGSKQQLANGKHFLQEQIHKALCAFHLAKNPEYQAREQLSLSEILMKKGLLKQGLKILAGVIENANENEWNELLLDAYRLKFLRITHAGVNTVFRQEAELIVKNSKPLMEELSRGLDTRKQFLNLYKIVKEKGLNINGGENWNLDVDFWWGRIGGMNSFREKVNATNIAYWLFEAHEQRAEANRFLNHMALLYAEEPKWQIRSFPAYSILLYQIGVVHFQKENFQELELVVGNLRALQTDVPKNRDKVNLRLLGLRSDSLERLLISFGGNEEKVKHYQGQPTISLESQSGLELEYILSIRSLDIVILFLQQSFQKAQVLINNSLEQLPLNSRENWKLVLRLMRCIIFYAQGHLDLMEAEVHNLRRKLKQFPTEEAMLLNYLKLCLKLGASLAPAGVLRDFWQGKSGLPPLNAYQKAGKLVLDRMVKALPLG